MARRSALLAFAFVALGCASVPVAASAEDRVVGIGDSIMGFSNSYVDRYAARAGVSDVRKFTSGNTAAEVANIVLPNAIAQIDDGTDTKAVIVQLGGQDYLRGH